MLLRQHAVPAVAFALTAALTACGSDDTPASNTAATTQAPTNSTASVTLNAADIEFAQGMIAHHEQAIEMAEIALDPDIAAGQGVADLASRIKDAQDLEIELMTGWLTAAGESVAMDTSDGHDMSSMEGMMTAEQMDSLAARTGADFDQMWLETMIAHHEGAIAQSQTVIANGSNPDVVALAGQIIAVQQAEIAEMQALSS